MMFFIELRIRFFLIFKVKKKREKIFFFSMIMITDIIDLFKSTPSEIQMSFLFNTKLQIGDIYSFPHNSTCVV
jgi:hypothetical protein